MMMRWHSIPVIALLVVSAITVLAYESDEIAPGAGALIEEPASVIQPAGRDEVSSFSSAIRLPVPEGRLAVDPDILAAMEEGKKVKTTLRNEIPSSIADGSDRFSEMFNGTYIDNQCTISDNLYYPENDPSGTKGNYIDWFKMSLSDVDPSFPGKAKNVSIDLELFECNGTTLYELTMDNQGEIGVDYVDFLELYVLYNDPMWGNCQQGGRKFRYDDGDDNDGWIYDGGHYETHWRDNWTTSFKSVGNSSGEYDPNGNESGLTEVGWYYIGIAFNYYMTANAVPRPDFRINYTLTFETKEEINNFPIRANYPQGAPNSMATSSPDLPMTMGRTHSGLNYFDWYRIKGSDPEKDWNLSVWVNVSWTVWPKDQDFGVTIDDSWMYIMLVWWGEGEDGVFGTSDDGWETDYKILYFVVSYLDKNGKNVPNMQQRFLQTGGNNMHVNLRHINDRLDTPVDPHPILAGKDPRTMFLGLYSKPVRFARTQTGGIIQTYADYQVFDQYKIALSIRETKPNTAPTLSDLVVGKDDPPRVVFEDPYTGNLETVFSFEVKYTDAEGDPPAHVWIEFDKNTPYYLSVDMLQGEEMPQGSPKTGLKLRSEIEGRDIGTDPFPHMVRLWAEEDRPSWAPGKSQRSNHLWFNDSLRVLSDDPVHIIDGFDRFYKADEDGDPIGVPLIGEGGMFADPENQVLGFHFSASEDGPWSNVLELDIANISAVPFEGRMCAVADLRPNKHGNAEVWVRCYDAVSEAISSFVMNITEVNDPPFVKGVMIGNSVYVPDYYDPRMPSFRKFPEYPMEDRPFMFRILAFDTDDADDATPLEFEYSPFDTWENRPSVDRITGNVTLLPTNNDTISDFMDLTITVSDGRDAVTILCMALHVINMNDPPTITVNGGKIEYLQDEMMRVSVNGQDIDEGDLLVYGVNMASEVGGIPPISSQVPVCVLERGIDWDIDPITGVFWFLAEDQKLWEMPGGILLDEIYLEFEFAVTDKEGESASCGLTIKFIDRNSPPPQVQMIYYDIPDSDPSSEGIQGLGMNLWLKPEPDPDGDPVIYRWSFSDGGSSEGIRVHHDFMNGGEKVVQVYAFDGQASSNVTRLIVRLVEPAGNDLVPNNDDDGGKGGLLLPMIVFLMTLIVAAAISATLIFVFVLPRKTNLTIYKKAPFPPTEYESGE